MSSTNSKPTAHGARSMERATLNAQGHEVGDPKPVAMPLGYKRPETLAEQVQRLVRTTISRQAAEEGMETFEEAEDFGDDEDGDLGSPYETHFDPVLGRDISPMEFRQAEAVYRQRYLEAQRAYFQSLDRTEVLERPARYRRRAGEPREAARRDAGQVSGDAPSVDPPAAGPRKPA